MRVVERIVIPIEGSAREYEVQRWAAELAAGLEVPILAVHVATSGGRPAPDLFSYVQGECKKWGVSLERRTIEGREVAAELVQELDVRDLVLLGTRRLASGYTVGSVAGELVRRAPCPVQLVRLA